MLTATPNKKVASSMRDASEMRRTDRFPRENLP